jgi:uncharacterized protein YceK
VKKIMGLGLVVCFMVLVSGCYSVRVLSDRTAGLTLASKTENLPYKESYKVWYILWGLVPISDNTTSKLFSNTNLKKVRITTKMGIDDILISMILGSFTSISSWTVEIEGSEK